MRACALRRCASTAKTCWIRPACWSVGDGSSKQRGHARPPKFFPVAEEVLFPSGSAALYRRAMLEQIGGFDEDFFLYCEDTDLGLARALGRMALPLRAGGRGGASLLALGGPRLAAEGILRGTQPPVRAGQELSGAHAGRGAIRFAGAILLAFAIYAARPRRGRPVSAGGRRRRGACRLYVLRAHAALLRNAPRPCCASAARSAARARVTPAHLPPAAALAFHFGAPGGAAVTLPAMPTPAPSGSLLIIVPAYNEEGAVGGVVRAIHAAMPGTPVLVIDDCSLDATQRRGPRGRRAGAGAAASPGAGRLRAGGLQAGFRAGIRIRHPRGWRRPARRARHPAHLRSPAQFRLSRW